MQAQAPREDLRQWLQLTAAAGALTLRWIDAPTAILTGTVALLFVLIVVPRLGDGLYRPGEPRDSAPIGLVLYPATLLLLVTLFWSFGGMPHVVAAIWGLFACGDAAATLLGRGEAAGLPWNPKKSWHGSLAYWICGSVPALFLLAWVGERPDVGIAGGPVVAWILCVAVGGLCAFLESLPVRRFNDNFWVPLVGAVALYTGLLLRASHMQANLPRPGPFALQAVVLAALVAWAWTRGAWGVTGALAGLGTALVAAMLLGPGGAVALIALALITWRAADYAHRRRLALDADDAAGRAGSIAAGGPRWSAALVVVATQAFLVLAFLAFSTGVGGGGGAGADPLHALFATGALGGLGGVAAARVARDLGPIFGRTPVLATTLERVAAGTTGAISLEGTLLGAGAACAIGVVGAVAGLTTLWCAPLVALAGALGSHLESFLAASISAERSPGELALVSVNSAVAGLVTILLTMLIF